MKKMNKKGFTLIEMLVVIAIIAILVSIIIPVIGDSTEKAREATDASNIRAKISEATAEGVASGTNATREYTLTQKVADWATVTKIGNIDASDVPSSGTVTITYTASTGVVTIAAKS